MGTYTPGAEVRELAKPRTAAPRLRRMRPARDHNRGLQAYLARGLEGESRRVVKDSLLASDGLRFAQTNEPKRLWGRRNRTADLLQ